MRRRADQFCVQFIVFLPAVDWRVSGVISERILSYIALISPQNQSNNVLLKPYLYGSILLDVLPGVESLDDERRT